MKAKIEFHILQSFAPSNLNRDDTGSPKDAIFGGVRRGRISSQSLKRAARTYMRDSGLLPESASSIRTKRLVGLLADRLSSDSVSLDTATKAATNVIELLGSGKSKMKIKANDDGEHLTEYLLFIGESELREIADLIVDDVEELSNPKSKSLQPVADAVKELLKRRGAGAVDVALFGRMLANLPDANADASCQVAHAISTHRVDREFDYYTAVDDRKPADNSGADMIGTIEFNSACYYRYSVIDTRQLLENLAGNDELLANTVEAYTRAAAEAIPTGKQNTFAAHNLPAVVLVTVRRNQGPRNLANAFEMPIRAGGNAAITTASSLEMRSTWEALDAAYGGADEAFVLDLTGEFDGSTARKVASLDELAKAVRQAVS